MDTNIFIRLILACLLMLPLWVNGKLHTATAATTYEGYYLYLGNYPSEANPGWHEEAQGLTHDLDHWFITQAGSLWRIPVWRDLGSVAATHPGVTKIELSQVSQLSSFNHLGDLTHYEFEGKGFLIVPLEGEGACNAIGIFLADTLQYVDSKCLPGQPNNASWVAVDPLGVLYSSNFNAVAAIMKYTVDWRRLKENGELIIASAGNLNLFDETGRPLQLNGLQGGEVSPSGELLYVMADGLHVFDMATHRRIQRSTNGFGYFNYEFHPGWSQYEEPEGITIWDLDDGQAPGIRGQLHAILLDNDWPSDDDVYIKHYTDKITVDATYNGAEQGTPTQPFNTVAEAHNLAWDGATISIRPGSFPEKITLSKRVRVVAPAGTVQIGK